MNNSCKIPQIRRIYLNLIFNILCIAHEKIKYHRNNDKNQITNVIGDFIFILLLPLDHAKNEQAVNEFHHATRTLCVHNYMPSEIAQFR